MLYLIIFLGALYLLYKYFTAKEDFWAKQGVEYKKGRFLLNIITRKHILDLDMENYKSFKQQGAGGIYEFFKPSLFVTDLDLVKNVLVKDFDYFVNRRSFGRSNNETDQCSFMLFLQEGNIWKNLRATLSPLFTTGKIKRMFQTFDECGATLVENMKAKYIKEPCVDIEDVIGRYTMSVIANSVFGIDAKVYEKEESEFIKISSLFSNPGNWKLIQFLFKMIFPKVAIWLDMPVFGSEMNDFYTKIIEDAIRRRKLDPDTKWNDFLELMLESRAGKLSKEIEDLDVFEKEAQLSGKSKIPLNDNLIIGNCILFLGAGFDTTRTALIWSLFYLAKEPEIQEKLYREIKEKFIADGNKFTYESVNNLEEVGKYVSEVLRLNPPAGRLERKSTQEYTMETKNGVKITIPKDTIVQIPVYAFHMDPEFYPNPTKFDPERFSNEVKNQRHPYAYQPFGNGPRNCIGMRFALTELKIALSHIIMNFKVEPCEKTVMNPKTARLGTMKPTEKMFLAFKTRN